LFIHILFTESTSSSSTALVFISGSVGGNPSAASHNRFIHPPAAANPQPLVAAIPQLPVAVTLSRYLWQATPHPLEPTFRLRLQRQRRVSLTKSLLYSRLFQARVLAGQFIFFFEYMPGDLNFDFYA
jgi:hypothetical protein